MDGTRGRSYLLIIYIITHMNMNASAGPNTKCHASASWITWIGYIDNFWAEEKIAKCQSKHILILNATEDENTKSDAEFWVWLFFYCNQSQSTLIECTIESTKVWLWTLTMFGIQVIFFKYKIVNWFNFLALRRFTYILYLCISSDRNH